MSSTLVETSKIIELSECNLETKSLLTGTLLKWIDITACLSAEKHANAPCVTASVDDLQLQKTIRLGQVLIIKAWVNRAWNTSMEVEVSVCTEEVTQEQSNICKAYFTFVTQRNKDGEKQLVKPIEPRNENEKIQFRLANERKRMRLDYRESLKSLKENSDLDDLSLFNEGKLQKDGSVVKVEDTFSQSIEIVLPQHANHHQTTFGGQLMAWMEATGTISARRLSHCLPRLVAVDEVFFRAPSKVGDRIVIKSCVNNTFDKSMEVGVRVEAYEVGGDTRHIQSAYFTFIAPDQNGNPQSLPKMYTTIKENRKRMICAEKRVTLRTERHILCSDKPIQSVALTKYNQRILCYKNIHSLTHLYNEAGFQVTYQKDGLRLYQLKCDGNLCIRVEVEIQAKPSAAFNVLSDHTLRKHWDMAVTDVKVVKEIRKNEDYILHYSMQNLSPRDNVLGDDFVVLASTRTDSRDMYMMIAYRSVLIDQLPPVREYHRAENKCSGFVIEPYKSLAFGNGCKITYVNELTDHVFQYVKQDLKGATHSLAKRALALKELIKTHVPSDT